MGLQWMACARQVVTQFAQTQGSYQMQRLPTTQHLHKLHHNTDARQILTVVVVKPFESTFLFYDVLLHMQKWDTAIFLQDYMK